MPHYHDYQNIYLSRSRQAMENLINSTTWRHNGRRSSPEMTHAGITRCSRWYNWMEFTPLAARSLIDEIMGSYGKSVRQTRKMNILIRWQWDPTPGIIIQFNHFAVGRHTAVTAYFSSISSYCCLSLHYIALHFARENNSNCLLSK